MRENAFENGYYLCVAFTLNSYVFVFGIDGIFCWFNRVWV